MSARGSSTDTGWITQRELVMPAARNECYSAREIYQSVRAIRAMRKACAADERQALEQQLPRGLVGGFEAFVERDGALTARLTGNHPKRRKLLDCAEDMPFTLHESLMELSPRRALTIEKISGCFWHQETSFADRAAIVNEAEAALLLIR